MPCERLTKTTEIKNSNDGLVREVLAKLPCLHEKALGLTE